MADHPETVAAMGIIKKLTPTTGFADSTFRALNTFHLVGQSGARTPVRWWLAPQQYALAPGSGDNALFDALVRQVRSGPLRWKLVLTVGTAAAPIDPTVPWPDDRRPLDAGTLTLTGAETERAGNARDINFDPLVLPVGIEPSDDPILGTRSAVYAASYRARTGRQPAPSAVQVDRVTP